MQVIATAGHVDHGKSALLRALTGMEPDRWAEERRRGMTIDLGYVWLPLPSGEQLAFVDVPGHERFVPNMLAGVGPVPAVLFVVAADGGWMPQSAEHLAVIDALRHWQRSARRDPRRPGRPGAGHGGGRAQMIAATSLGEVEAVAVSAVTGAGAARTAGRAGRLAAACLGPIPARRCGSGWTARSASPARGRWSPGRCQPGTVRRGDELMLTPSMRPVRVRGHPVARLRSARVSGVARVALNLRGDRASGGLAGGWRWCGPASGR